MPKHSPPRVEQCYVCEKGEFIKDNVVREKYENLIIRYENLRTKVRKFLICILSTINS